MMVGTQLTDGMKVLLVDDVMTAGTAVREVIPKLKAEADVESSAWCFPWIVWKRPRIPTRPR